jgi:hypothetical protein
MPSTYTLISSNVLSTAAASVTFSAIPSTYTDLVLRWSVRDSNVSFFANFSVTLNSDTTNNSYTFMRGIGATPTTSRSTGYIGLYGGFNNGSQTTANSFSNGEMYIPNYAGTTNKPASAFNTSETNDTSNATIYAVASLNTGTSAVTALTLNPSATFLSGSSFYLYGIKNS